MSKEMNVDTAAERLSKIVAQRKKLEQEAEETKAESAYTPKLEKALKKVEELREKIDAEVEPLVKRASKLKNEESDLRGYLIENAPIGANWRTLYGTVGVQGYEKPVVTRFSSVPKEFRKAPEECLNKSAVNKAFKDGGKVPGIKLEEFPKLVVK